MLLLLILRLLIALDASNAMQQVYSCHMLALKKLSIWHTVIIDLVCCLCGGGLGEEGQ